MPTNRPGYMREYRRARKRGVSIPPDPERLAMRDRHEQERMAQHVRQLNERSELRRRQALERLDQK
jgi:hypothetical protein